MSKIRTETYTTDLLKEIRDNTFKVACGAGTTTTEFDVFTLCNPLDGSIVIASVSYSITGVPTTAYYLPTGAPYVGATPVNCSGSSLESDAREGCAANISMTQWVVKQNGNPTGTIYYTDVNGAVIPAPAPGTFSFGPCNPAKQIFQRCLCDDVNGDGSLIINYVQFYTYDPATNAIAVTGNWLADLSATYTPINPIDCDSIGTDVKVVVRRFDLIGSSTWTMPVDVQSFTIRVRRIGDILNPPTITDNNGTATPLFLGDVETYSILTEDSTVLQGTFSVTNNNAGDYITINYTQIT